MKRQSTPLDTLAALLRRKPLTVREIAAAMRCCKPTAYERVRALIKSGAAVYQLRSKDPRRTGPVATAYGLR